MIGTNGDDRLSSGAGTDHLVGGKGDDTLSGGEGRDTINGGSGRDVLNGDQGKDLFIYGNVTDSRADLRWPILVRSRVGQIDLSRR